MTILWLLPFSLTKDAVTNKTCALRSIR
jgi:hypothetical protein